MVGCCRFDVVGVVVAVAVGVDEKENEGGGEPTRSIVVVVLPDAKEEAGPLPWFECNALVGGRAIVAAGGRGDFILLAAVEPTDTGLVRAAGGGGDGRGGGGGGGGGGGEALG